MSCLPGFFHAKGVINQMTNCCRNRYDCGTCPQEEECAPTPSPDKTRYCPLTVISWQDYEYDHASQGCVCNYDGIPLPLDYCMHTHEGYVRTALLDLDGFFMKQTSTMNSCKI